MIDLPVIDGPDDAESEKPRERFWRSLAHLQNDPHLKELSGDEFMPGASDRPSGASRREFLQIMGASMALAGLAACRRPVQQTLPYTRQPEEIIPGVPIFYATAMPYRGILRGLLVESHEGRPTKIEGNPEHPTSFGATSIFEQASILTLYDPDRSQAVVHDGSEATWRDFLNFIERFTVGTETRRLVILSEPTSSSTVQSLRERLSARYPQLQWITYSAEGDNAPSMGLQASAGRPLRPLYRFSEAEVIVSLDADFLGTTDLNVIHNTAEFGRGRQVDGSTGRMSRLYSVESVLSQTGGMADHRRRLRASEIADFTRALATRLGGGGESGQFEGDALIDAITRDLRAAGGRGIVLAGDSQPPEVHALAASINAALGSTIVTYLDTEEEPKRPQAEEMAQLVDDMRTGRVDALVTIGVNPVYDAPFALNFEEALRSVDQTIHLGTYLDETGQACRWHIPRSHYLEAWGDGRAYDGTRSVIQPLIAPLYETKSEIELLNTLLDGTDVSGYDLVREEWRGVIGGDFERGWRRVLHDGYLPDSGYSTTSAGSGGLTSAVPAQPAAEIPEGQAAGSSPSAGASAAAIGRSADTTAADTTTAVTTAGDTTPADIASGAIAGRTVSTPRDGDFELVFHLDPTILDGTFANNAWLQELPDPTTKLVWDNVALMGSGTAERLGVQVRYEKGYYIVDIVEISTGDQTIELPAWIQPGLAENSIHLNLGYGREISSKRPPRKARFFDLDHYTDVYAGGPLANGVGVNVARLRHEGFEPVATGAEVTRTGRTYKIVTTQEHGSMEGRPLVRMGTLAEFSRNPEFAAEAEPHLPGAEAWEEYPTLWEEDHPSRQARHKSRGFYENQWGMVIDLNSCTGCHSCVIACNSENNIQMVGKNEVSRGREMHWLRIDRYFVSEGENADEPKLAFQPIPCMHCDNAPCESVCPVAATSTSSDGINEMTYNRCIGTRYCSNNCPYKVRRFNFFNWSGTLPVAVQMAQNPDVTVRFRGIMEKCTFCVQRVREVQRRANLEERTIRDGEVQTACQQACPAGAITFGDLNDAGSRVSELRQSPRRYDLLAYLNTKPRTSYLARVTNPNPEYRET